MRLTETHRCCCCIIIHREYRIQIVKMCLDTLALSAVALLLLEASILGTNRKTLKTIDVQTWPIIL